MSVVLSREFALVRISEVTNVLDVCENQSVLFDVRCTEVVRISEGP